MAKLMAHLVAGYPTDEIAYKVAMSLVKGGADILEIQLAFSDPSADGPSIQEACSTVLKRGYSTNSALEFISSVHRACPSTIIYLMSYASLVYTPGVVNFCHKARMAGVKGLIVPDLPFDCDEGLRKACASEGLLDIPVAAPSMAKERLELMVRAGYECIYAALRVGITGQATVVDDSTLSFLKALRASGAKIYGGFGISSRDTACKVAPLVDAVVAGSVFVRLIKARGDCLDATLAKIEAKARELKV